MKKYIANSTILLSLIGLSITLSGCGSSPVKHPPYMMGHGAGNMIHAKNPEEYALPMTLDMSAVKPLSEILPKLERVRVVYVGETHDRYDHHLNQLEIIRYLHSKGKKLSIGVEFFQKPYQKYLDDYIAGTISEAEMLRGTEYYSRWRFDYRLYQPILQFARENRIPVIALDIETEIRVKVGRGGLDTLNEEELSEIPKEMDNDNEEYKSFIQHAFRAYHSLSEDKFKNFLQAQVVRDETMAETAANYLKEDPKRMMVVLGGTGHMISGLGIPNRVKRRLGIDQTIILNDLGQKIESGVADYILFPEPIRLPEAAVLGIMMQDNPAGDGVLVASLANGGAAQTAGVEEGDLLIALNGAETKNSGEVKILLLNASKGDKVSLKLEREGLLGKKMVQLDAILQ